VARCVAALVLEISKSVVSDERDRQLEDARIEKALRSSGYPDWTFQKFGDQMMMKATKRKQKNDPEIRSLMWEAQWKGWPG